MSSGMTAEAMWPEAPLMKIRMMLPFEAPSL